MNSHKFRWLLVVGMTAPMVLVLPFVVIGQEPLPKADPVGDMVPPLLGRSEAIFSGRFLFHYKSGFAHLNEILHDEDMQFSFSGTSWVTRSDFRIVTSHRGHYVEHIRHPQEKGTVDHTATVELAKPIESAYKGCLPHRSGTILYKKTEEFIRANTAQGKKVGEADVNGVKTQVLEWPVPAKEVGDVFGSVVVAKRLTEPGVLRLYVAPQLGYVIPRTEHVSTANGGEVDAVIDASQFETVAPGVYFPKLFEYRSFLEKTQPAYYFTFAFMKVDQVNDEIGDDEFVLAIPPGTAMADARDPTNVLNFRYDPSTVSAELNTIIIPEQPTALRRSWWLATLIGGGLGGILLLVYIIRRSQFGGTHGRA